MAYRWARFREVGTERDTKITDLDHTYHILLRLGIREKYTLVSILLASLLMAVIGILGELYGVAERVMFVGFLLIFGIHFFSYRIFLRKI